MVKLFQGNTNINLTRNPQKAFQVLPPDHNHCTKFKEVECFLFAKKITFKAFRKIKKTTNYGDT